MSMLHKRRVSVLFSGGAGPDAHRAGDCAALERDGLRADGGQAQAERIER
jgi:hypothetical protein